MRNNASLTKLNKGENCVGLWFNTGNHALARMLAAQGLMQWLLVDTEHCPTDLSQVAVLCAAISDVSGGRCTPIVRVVDGTVHHIKQALDAGAQGIMVPMVETAAQAADVVRFAKYPPMGARGNGGLMPHLGYGMNRMQYTEAANRETLVAVQIETKTAIDNLDAIAQVPGVDVLFIGPNDLHISLGYAPSYWSDAPLFRAAAQKVLDACKRHGKQAGILMGNATQTKARLAEGFSFVGMGGDTLMLLNAVGAGYAEITGATPPAGGWGGLVQVN